ncbi:hypothetical protein C8034_v010465 [Colletotrichum sidae]|uniref:Apple domain-containing protein n=1 Tax=Colletotrichum sidae TaxID=1347389 RepID=A0A4R8TN09_9PEZI|nr:hypothetical protein C8034_v010465 [Colletotrichum sidae]
MRSAFIVAAFAGITSANPIASRDTSAQTDLIDLSAFDAAPKVTKTGPAMGATAEKPTYNQAQRVAAAAKDAITDPVSTPNTAVSRRDSSCSGANREPTGYGPVSSPDTYDTFMADPQFDAIAKAAKAPYGYELAFTSVNGSMEGQGYQGLYTLQSYDAVKCQQYCDAAPACMGFNIFMERNPALTPSDSCVNPGSTTNYKCTLWGAGVSQASATNVGQWRNDFHVGIRGSNGYNKIAPPPSYTNFTGPAAFDGATQAPYSYMGVKYFAGVFDPSQCASACQATTQYDRGHPNGDGTYDACNFFNAYVLNVNGVPQGTTCSMYTRAWDRSYSTNIGQWRGTDYYSVSYSFGYTLNPQDSGRVSASN